ncbi:unnamed protein product [Brassica oleracea]
MGASWLHGVSNDNPLAPIIRRLGLSLYHTSGDDSFLYDHDLQSRCTIPPPLKKIKRRLCASKHLFGVSSSFGVSFISCANIKLSASNDAIRTFSNGEKHFR